MRLTIRDFQSSDRPTLVAGLDSMQDHLASIDPWRRTIRTADHGAMLAPAVLRRVKERRGFTLVAVVEGNPVGVAAAWLGRIPRVERTEQLPTLIGYLSDLVVLPAWRGKGIGTKLLRRVERRFRSLGCDQMTLGVFAPNTKAFKLYTREGFVPRSLQLGKELGKPKPVWPRKLPDNASGIRPA